MIQAEKHFHNYGSRVLTSINYGSNTWMLKSVELYIWRNPLLRLLCRVACEVPQGGTALRVANPQCGVREFWPKLLLLPPLPKLAILTKMLKLTYDDIERKGAIVKTDGEPFRRIYFQKYSFGF